MVRIFSLLLAASTLLAGGSMAVGKDVEAAKDLIGRKAPEFSLRDQYGKPHTLADLADRKVVVLAFLGNECPLAKLYAGRLEQIAKDYAPRGVTVLGVNANRQDALTEIATFTQQHKLTFPMLKDAGNTVADALGASRTPQVFVLDEGRVVRYAGRIDDQYGIGFLRPQATRHDLTTALDELLAGKEVSQPTTEAPGCLIGRVCQSRAAGDNHLRKADFASAQRAVRELPSRRRHCPVPDDQLRRSGRLGRHDPRGRRRGADAAVVCRSCSWQIRE